MCHTQKRNTTAETRRDRSFASEIFTSRRKPHVLPQNSYGVDAALHFEICDAV